METATEETGGHVGRLNRLSAEEAERALQACCGSSRWARETAALRPFRDVGQLFDAGGRVWFGLESADWLEAFRAHPRIGEKRAEVGVSEAARRWSEGEQSRARDAATQTLDALAAANRAYEEKFGFIFIICATGRTAAEMLAVLRERMENDAETELRVAAAEQWRITELRLRKLLDA
ncbi:MAG TPA: 2-oxo-4-hydroxy-4-carboxy-5-ureidoimidazoline decarboxylase [Pyrinomonadaceae bacterium]|jgi:OHCU decarboxylase|nr:2-oxo-4-hydroxy-4-carboxy-5-ureidoimidazoline decarboxylase [Pyrinomonadaceae bacterium]